MIGKISKQVISSLMVFIMLVTLSSFSLVYSSHFADENQIGEQYKNAVFAMNKINVIIGFEDGNFYPKRTLTRAQGAKIITYIILGYENAMLLQCDSESYLDVSKDDWFSSSVEWCTENEIILGFGDGTFGPLKTLTGYQFAKMLLCALGLGVQERYIGEKWKDSVQADCIEYGIYPDDVTFNPDFPITREQAAYLAFSAISISRYSGIINSSSAESDEKDSEGQVNDETYFSSPDTYDVSENTKDTETIEGTEFHDLEDSSDSPNTDNSNIELPDDLF